MSNLPVRDIFVKITRPDGRMHLECRSVWDAQRFVAALQNQLKTEAERDKHEPAHVSLATSEEWKIWRARGKK